jgi:hypothetical protein
MFQAIGLRRATLRRTDGATTPTAGPADPDPGAAIWLVTAGEVIMGAGTLGVIHWVEHMYTDAAHTTGVVTCSPCPSRFFSISMKDPRRTALTQSEKTFVKPPGSPR